VIALAWVAMTESMTIGHDMVLPAIRKSSRFRSPWLFHTP
jgi:hypothetical protein